MRDMEPSRAKELSPRPGNVKIEVGNSLIALTLLSDKPPFPPYRPFGFQGAPTLFKKLASVIAIYGKKSKRFQELAVVIGVEIP